MFGFWDGRQGWPLVGQIAGRIAGRRMPNFSGFELDMHCNSVYG